MRARSPKGPVLAKGGTFSYASPMNSTPSRLLFLLAIAGIFPVATLSGAEDEALPPVKVFVLAGQSNMVGAGMVEVPERTVEKWKTKDELNEDQIAAKSSGSLRKTVLSSSGRDSLYDGLLASDGTWTVRDDVWVYFDNARTGVQKGGLSVGFGSREDRIGPELGFGRTLGDAFEEPILLIKTCWGGRSLAVDFRPPSAGKHQFTVKPRLDGTVPKAGEYYQRMIAEVNEVLANLDTLYPELDGHTPEIAGVFWHQGWNDGCNQAYADEYEENLLLLIADLRRDLGVKDLPFVIANSGFGGEDPRRGVVGVLQTTVQPAQEAAESLPQVACVDTRPFYRPPEKSPGSGDIEHWFSNAESYFLIGDASARAMLGLLENSVDSE